MTMQMCQADQLSAPSGCTAATETCLAQGRLPRDAARCLTEASLPSSHCSQPLPLPSPFVPQCLPNPACHAPPQCPLPKGQAAIGLSQRGRREGGTYLGASGLVLPPLKCGQMATQPSAQVVEEDHVEWDAHQGVEDTEDLACLGAGCQVPISCRGGGACKRGGVQNYPPQSLAEVGGLPSPLGGGGEAPLISWTVFSFSARVIPIYKTPACLPRPILNDTASGKPS